MIDASSCVAQGDCAELAPDVFEVVEEVSVVIGTGSLEEMKAAAEACPTEAIVLIDEETGQQLAP